MFINNILYNTSNESTSADPTHDRTVVYGRATEYTKHRTRRGKSDCDIQ